MNCFSEEQLNKISHLIQEIEKLNDVEKLFLYIQLPSGRGTEGKSKFNGAKSNQDLFTKKPDQETSQTYTWILSHLEVDQNVSLPKQEVYDEYKAFCQANRFEPLCVADFGKAMKHAFPCIKPRRLGQRGSSRYCYSGLRKKYKIQPPSLPDLIEPTFCMVNDCSQAYNQIIRDCRDNPNECPLNSKPNFTGYEVMNLKIDPTIHHDQFNSNYHNNEPHQPQQQNHSALQLACNNNKPASQPPETLKINDSSGMTFQNTVNTVNEESYSIQTSAPSSDQASRSYNYVDVIQQPGTPDDDDYRHNYQDISAMVNMFNNGSLSNGQTSRDRASFEATPMTTSNFVYQVSAGSSRVPKTVPTRPDQHPPRLTGVQPPAATGGDLLSSTSSNQNHTSQQFQQQHTSQNGPISQTTTDSLGAVQTYPILTYMDGAHIDYCASPFQSPASTPYPRMNNYLPPEHQDYYPPDCIRYSDS